LAAPGSVVTATLEHACCCAVQLCGKCPDVDEESREIPEADPNISGEVVMDSNWRWIHDGNGKDCYDDNTWISINK
jgi:hypothetical protein